MGVNLTVAFAGPPRPAVLECGASRLSGATAMSDHLAAHLLVSAEGHDGAASHQGGFFGLVSASPADAIDRWVATVLDDWPADLRHEEHRQR